MPFCYMPILKWKQGEQITLRELDPADRTRMLPLIELQAIVVPTGSTLQAALKLELTAVVKKLKKAGFDTDAVAIDTSSLYPTYKSPTRLLSVALRFLKKQGINALPVIYPDMVLSEPAELKEFSEFSEVVFRIRTGSYLAAQISLLIKDLRAALPSRSIGVHVLLDMYDIVGSDPKAKAKEMDTYIVEAKKPPRVATITVAGGSFPLSLAGTKQGLSSVPRIEWQAWQELRKKTVFHDVLFGDYAVTNPVPLVGIDPRKMNPSAQIRYTRKNDWMLLKAGGSKTYGMGQYNQLCNLLVAHTDYAGATFSFGDERYDYHTQAGASSGSYMTWRRDATSHHIVFTVRDIAPLFGL